MAFGILILTVSSNGCHFLGEKRVPDKLVTHGSKQVTGDKMGQQGIIVLFALQLGGPGTARWRGGVVGHGGQTVCCQGSKGLLCAG